MSTRRTGFAIYAIPLILGLGLAATAQAQHTPDPYNIVGEYNRQYEPFMYANASDLPGTLPGQDRFDSRSGLRNANRYQSFLEDEEDSEILGRSGMTGRNSGPGIPYYRANRQYDHTFQREYRPNSLADRSYYSNQQQLNEKYFEAIKESDPRKRTQLLREYNAENLRTARGLSPNRNAPDRDRMGANAGALNGAEDEEQPRSEARSRSTGLATPPTTRGRVPATTRGLPSAAHTAPRAGGLTAPPPPGSARGGATAPPRSRSASSATDVLERSELLDRASRAVAPVAPRSTSSSVAPPPPR